MYADWEKRRHKTFIVYTIQYLVDAIQLSIGYVTSWIYIKQIAGDSKHLNLYYGILHGAIYVPSFLFSNLVSYLADKNRKAKEFLLFGNFMAIIGCSLYVMPRSLLYPIVGRFLIGFSMLMRPVMIGEIARVFERGQLVNRMKIFRGVQGLGRAIAPVSVLLFMKVNIWIGPVYIAYSNATVVVTFFLSVTTAFLVWFFAYNLSSEFDLKEYNQRMSLMSGNTASEKDNASNEKQLSIKTGTKSYSIIKIIKQAIQILDVYLCLFTEYLRCVIAVVILLKIPNIVLDELRYTDATVNAAILSQVVVFIVLMLILYKLQLNLVDGAIVAWLCCVISICLMLGTSKNHPYAVNFAMLTLSYALTDVVLLNLNVYASVGLAQQVSSQYQSFMDSIRMQVGLLGNITGALLEAAVIKHAFPVFLTLVGVSIIPFLLTIYKRKEFLSPTIKIS